MPGVSLKGLSKGKILAINTIGIAKQTKYH